MTETLTSQTGQAQTRQHLTQTWTQPFTLYQESIQVVIYRDAEGQLVKAVAARVTPGETIARLHTEDADELRAHVRRLQDHMRRAVKMWAGPWQPESREQLPTGYGA